MTEQPTTAAGRKLSRAWRARDIASPGLNEAWPEQFDRYILDIEADARQQQVDACFARGHPEARQQDGSVLADPFRDSP